MKTALVLTGEGYGNLIMATPLMAAVAYMGYEVHVLAQANWPDAGELLRGWELVRGIHTDRSQVRGKKWGVVVGTVWARDGHDIWAEEYVWPMHEDLREVHEVDANMTAAVKLGWCGPTPPTHCEHDPKPPGFLNTAYIAVCPGFGNKDRGFWARKAWPHWAEFCEASRLPTVALGAKGEGLGCATREYFGALPIRTVAGVLRGAKFVVAVDNGLAHIAAALGVRTVVLFGATSDVKNRPLGRDVRVVCAPVDCRPCQMTDRWHACKHWRCMEEITPEMVWEAAA